MASNRRAVGCSYSTMVQKQTWVARAIDRKVTYLLSNEVHSFRVTSHRCKCTFPMSAPCDSVITHHKTSSRLSLEAKTNVMYKLELLESTIAGILQPYLVHGQLPLSCIRTTIVRNFHIFTPCGVLVRSSNHDLMMFRSSQLPSTTELRDIGLSFPTTELKKELLLIHVAKCGSALLHGNCLGSNRYCITLYARG